MTSFLLIFQFIVAAILTVAVLLQKSSSIGLGAYSGSNESLFGAKGPAGFMAKFTFIVGIIFILNTVALGYFYNQTKKVSVAEDIKVEKSVIPTSPAPSSTAPEAPSAPKAQSRFMQSLWQAPLLKTVRINVRTVIYHLLNTISLHAKRTLPNLFLKNGTIQSLHVK